MPIIDPNIWAYYFDRNAPERRFVVDHAEKALATGKIAINAVIIIEAARFLIKNLGPIVGGGKVNGLLGSPFTAVDLKL